MSKRANIDGGNIGCKTSSSHILGITLPSIQNLQNGQRERGTGSRGSFNFRRLSCLVRRGLSGFPVRIPASIVADFLQHRSSPVEADGQLGQRFFSLS